MGYVILLWHSLSLPYYYFYVEPPWVGGTNVCSRQLGHMTQLAAMLIYGKKKPSKIFFCRTGGPIFAKLGMSQQGLQPIILYSNDDPGVTLTYFTAKVKFANRFFYRKKGKTVDFSETVAASDMKGSRRIHLIECMKICEY